MAGNNLSIGINANTSGLKRGVKDVQSTIGGLGKTLQTAFGFTLGGIFSNILGVIKEAATSSVKIAARFEMINLQFEALIGNTAKAKKLMAELREFSVRTPFTPEDVFKAGKILLTQFPVGQVTGEIKMLGEIAAVTGKDLNELALIYAKVAERGKVNARVLNQFANAGIPIGRFLAQVKGSDAIRELSEQGQLSFNDMRDAMRLMADEWQGLDRASQSVTGRYSTLQGVVKEFLATLGEALKPQTLDALNGIIRAFGRLIEMSSGMKEFGNRVRAGFDAAISALRIFIPLKMAAFAIVKGKNPIDEFKAWFAGIDEKLKNYERFGSYSISGGKEPPPRMGGKDFVSPTDKPPTMAEVDAKMKSFGGDAAAGLFRYGAAMQSVPEMQLQEAKKQTELLGEMNQKLGNTPYNFSETNTGMRDGAGR